MLRLLLSLLNPFKKGKRRKKHSLLLSLRTCLFRICIIILRRYYRRYSYVDTISLGDLKVRQSRRDMEFEEWLSQLKIDIRPHFYIARGMPQKQSKHWLRPFYKFFRMELETIIINDKYEIKINRTHQLVLNTNVKGQLRLSNDNDILQRCEFNAIAPKQKFEDKALKPNVFNRPEATIISKKKRVSLGESKPITPDNIRIQEQPVLIQVRGAEIDESF